MRRVTLVGLLTAGLLLPPAMPASLADSRGLSSPATPVFALVVPQSGATATMTMTPSPTATLTDEQRLAQLDQQITIAWNAADWPQVLSLIDQVIAINPTHDDIQGKKHQAHLSYGWQLLTQGQCTESLSQFRQALLVKPDSEEAALGLQMVARYCDIPVPTSTYTPQPQPSVAPSLTQTPQAVSAPFQYTVKLGDTLYSLAQRYNTTVQAIMQINGMMNYALREGQIIWVPASGQALPGPLVHIVQPGETLYTLADKYRTTVWAIMAINNLKGSSVRAYQALFIPSASQAGPIIHIVQPNETLYTIATRYGTTVGMLMLANSFTSYTIHVYQRIIIPASDWEGWPPLSVWTGPSAGDCGHGSYTVRAGDTLYSIARRHGVTVPALMAANKLATSTIYVGTTLCIP